MKERHLPSDPKVVVAVLSEAIPYIRRFGGKVVVIKYGGNALAGAQGGAGSLDGAAPTDGGAPAQGGSASLDEAAPRDGGAPAQGGAPSAGGSLDEALRSFASDVVLLRSVGVLPVVVHGGGPQISELMGRLGKTPEFRAGLRVTDAESLDIVRMVLVGRVNRDIVDAINVHGPLAVGLSGEDAGLIEAGAHHADLGFVGEVRRVDPTILKSLIKEGLVPVVATIGADVEGQAYNINADTVAGALAAALAAEKLVFLTDVPGIRTVQGDPDSVAARLSVGDLERLIADGVIDGGMIPKAQACVDAVAAGVGSTHVLDGRVPHAVLIELFTEEGVGTMVTPVEHEAAGGEAAAGAAAADVVGAAAGAEGAAGQGPSAGGVASGLGTAAGGGTADVIGAAALGAGGTR